jgi:hypothetical protein
MGMKSKLAMLTMCAGATLAQAGPYDQPWTLFEPDHRSPTRDTAPATVMKINDRNTSIGRHDPYPPGKYKVELSVPGPRGVSNPTRQTMEVDAKGCTRYYFSAKRSSPTAKDWEAFISAEEPISECRRKFAKPT